MKYPEVGEIFYWKNSDGEIFEDTCLKIEGEDVSTLETMFFIELSKNGGGCFVCESRILDPNSEEVKNFKQEQAKKKIKEVINYINEDKVYGILFNKLIKHYNWEESTNILNILTNE